MTIEAIKKEIATLKAQIQEIDRILEEWDSRQDGTSTHFSGCGRRTMTHLTDSPKHIEKAI